MKNVIITKVLLAALGCAVVFAACKKDETDNTPEKIKKLMINWKINSITVPKAGQPDVDSSLLKTCMSDDIISFKNTGFDFQDATNKCDTSIFYYSKGAWGYDLGADSIKMMASSPAKYIAWKVLTLNDSLLKVRFTDSFNPAKIQIKTIVFKH